MRNQFVEATLGFDTATKTYAQLVGNMLTDNLSAKKVRAHARARGTAVRACGKGATLRLRALASHFASAAPSLLLRPLARSTTTGSA